MKHFLTALALLAVAGTGSVSAATRATQISVTGTGSVTMLPDQASVSASVVTNAPDADAAVGANNALYAKVTSALESAGIARSDVTLSYYNVNYVAKPEGAATNQPAYQQYGYTVTRSFSIKVRAIQKAGAVVDAATRAGATNIGNVEFGLADPSKARGEATTLAMADARSKAEAVAKAAGLHITGIRSIQLDGGGGVQPMMRMTAMAAPASPPTTFDPSNVNVASNVSVIFLAAP